MANMTDIRIQVEFHRESAKKLREAYLALIEGGVQSYTIGSRSLTKYDLEKIRAEIKAHEKAINELEAALCGKKRRKAVGVIPRDW